MALSISEITAKVNNLRQASRARDQRNKDVRDIRSGDVDTIAPSLLPDAWPKPIVANMIDTVARDYSEMMGVMPSINCTSGVITSASAKKFSAKRTKIAHYWVQQSGLPSGKQVEWCDNYVSYGMGIYLVEPDFSNKMPFIQVVNPLGCYPETDVFGRIRSFTRVWHEEAIHLVAKFPFLQRVFQGNNGAGDMNWTHQQIEVAKYIDADQMVMYLPSHSETVLMLMDNPVHEVMVAIGFRPGFDQEVRGAFDDAVWVQLAKGRMALLGLEATEKAIRAPLMLPRDVQKMTFGDDAIIRTDNPDRAKYLVRDMPQYAFQQDSMHEQELMKATRYNEARGGNIDASIITGKGVQALMGSFNTVITTGQQVASDALRRALELAFKMDEILWPNEQRTIRGLVNGTPFEESYIPTRDINGVHTVDITYGFAAGQDPARAIVALLQLRGDQLVPRDFVQRQLPMEMDINQIQIQIDNEQMTDALKQGIMAYLQNIGPITLQGGDPQQMLQEAATIIKRREKGVPLHEAILEAFTPKTSPEQQQAAQAGPAGPGGGEGGPGNPPPGIQQGGLPQGVAPGQAGMGPGGRPDMLSLLAGLRGGNATMGATVMRRQPI